MPWSQAAIISFEIQAEEVMPHRSCILYLQSWHRVSAAAVCPVVILEGWVKLFHRGVVEAAEGCEECGE